MRRSRGVLYGASQPAQRAGAAAARRVRELVEAAPPDGPVAVDLSRVREFQERGVAVLAEVLAGRTAAPVAVRGLRQHQVRMLRYLGVPDEAMPASISADVRP